MMINKTHSKLDLIEIINDLQLNIVFSHQDNKKDIQEKIKNFCEHGSGFIFKPNIYLIKNLHDLKCYLKNQSPKKKISIKEKKMVMFIAKNIINYCLHGKVLECLPVIDSNLFLFFHSSNSCNRILLISFLLNISELK